MAQLYAIEDTTMTALADATRGIVGATRLEPGEPVPFENPISKTPNAIDFETRNGDYSSSYSKYDVITVPGAKKIVVDVAYQTEGTNYDYLQIASGELTSMPSTATKYGGKTLTRKTFTFEDTDTITFYFKSDTSGGGYLGYYAECAGYDENDNLITALPSYVEVPNTLTIGEIIEELSMISPPIIHCVSKIPDEKLTYYYKGDEGLSYSNFDQVKINVEEYNPSQLILILRGGTSSNYTGGDVVLFYDGATWTEVAGFGSSSISTAVNVNNITFNNNIIHVKLSSLMMIGNQGFQLFYTA